ncbi:hypothetical protein [Streptomyces sp. BA2]|uniref:hypothetical protein n=1 Tax=Streptomyces sp. BA2 TaxID=436595 RepID=UPI001329C225|nr:hypothetical protein [Streptomyces sp. BA2]MWA08776.1 hypothetical protein [Streptomyces sp. BA2]
MGYAYYEIIRNGEKIEAGYSVKADCEKTGCKEKIDRGLGYLCGSTPGGDEYGCGGYFCGDHRLGGYATANGLCQTCWDAAAESARWIHPKTGEEFDLRDSYLPAGDRYTSDGIVWWYTGTMQNGSPVMACRDMYGDIGGAYDRLLSEGEWENAAIVYHRQWGAPAA